jgi:hypothetical protein
VRQEDIAQPGAQVVDGGDEPRLRGLGAVQRLLEARVRVDGRDDADVVPGRISPLLDLFWVSRTHPHTKDPSAKKAQSKWRRTTALEIPAFMIGLWDEALTAKTRGCFQGFKKTPN